jgi:hypothetical protein
MPPEYWDAQEKWDDIHGSHQPGFRRTFVLTLAQFPQHFGNYDLGFLVSSFTEVTKAIMREESKHVKDYAKAIQALAAHSERALDSIDQRLLDWSIYILKPQAELV